MSEPVSIPKLTEEEMASYAKQILDNPVFNLVSKSIEHDLLSRWKATNHDQVGLRETIWNQIQAIEYVNQKLKGCVTVHLLKKQESMSKV